MGRLGKTGKTKTNAARKANRKPAVRTVAMYAYRTPITLGALDSAVKNHYASHLRDAMKLNINDRIYANQDSLDLRGGWRTHTTSPASSIQINPYS